MVSHFNFMLSMQIQYVERTPYFSDFYQSNIKTFIQLFSMYNNINMLSLVYMFPSINIIYNKYAFAYVNLAYR